MVTEPSTYSPCNLQVVSSNQKIQTLTGQILEYKYVIFVGFSDCNVYRQ